MMCWLKQFMPLFTRICSSQKVSLMDNQTTLQGDEEGRDDHSDDCHGFLPISDNILTASEWAGGKEQAGYLKPHPGGLLDGAGRGYKKWRCGELY
jgi:hypothetical protein